MADSDGPDWARFAAAIAGLAGVDSEVVNRDTRLLSDLGLDSLSLAELIVCLVIDFNMDALAENLGDRDWEQITLGDLYDEAVSGGPAPRRPEYTLKLRR